MCNQTGYVANKPDEIQAVHQDSVISEHEQNVVPGGVLPEENLAFCRQDLFAVAEGLFLPAFVLRHWTVGSGMAIDEYHFAPLTSNGAKGDCA